MLAIFFPMFYNGTCIAEVEWVMIGIKININKFVLLLSKIKYSILKSSYTLER